MVYYVRKIARSKWPNMPLSDNPEKAIYEIGTVSADAITNCIKTQENKLSLWRVEEKRNSIEDIIPLIVGFERPDTCDIIYISEDTFGEEGITIEQSIKDANTPLEELKKYHYNAIIKDYDGLGKFAKVILKSLGNHKRFKGKEVKTKLREMLHNHEIEKGMISDKLFEKIS
ncbi:MAG: hypothetical protein HFI19_04215 [Lachnospiraceae bacterium]|uniref:hypothetical protein n=1 Tax=Candidatus Merdisoma sp. JLR.KK006 TaxID=3112626 RepID=UPI002FF0FF67|nr:hypothetical protein [Lachnospiraceae bacterium]